MRKVWIIILLCNFEFMAQAMARLTMERCLKNSLIKHDMIITKIRRSASEGDFIGLQGLYTQKLIYYVIENLPNNKVDEIIDEFKEEKRIAEEFATIAHKTESVLFSNDYNEDDIHSNG